MPEPFNDAAEAVDHWRRQADRAWRTYMETGDNGDRDDALNAATNYHRWVDAINDAIKDITDA